MEGDFEEDRLGLTRNVGGTGSKCWLLRGLSWFGNCGMKSSPMGDERTNEDLLSL